MKKIVFATLMMLFSIQFLSAQSVDAEKLATEMTAKQKTQLALTSDQEPKVQAINLTFFTESAKIKSNTDSRMAKMQALKKLDDQKTASMKEILTSEQYEKYRGSQKENRQQLREKFGNRK